MLQRIRNYLQANSLYVPQDLEARLKTIARQAVTLDAMRVKTLHFKADNGTDFTVELIEGSVWECGYHLNEEGELWFSLPYPGSFEMFNTPEKSIPTILLKTTQYPLNLDGIFKILNK
jgi:leucyl aminopeptidase (aminopeptidase T)